MAVKLEKSKTMSGDSRYSIKLTITETGTSVANNESTISYSLTATKSSGSGFYSNSAVSTIKVIIDGDTIVNKKIAYDFTGSTPKTITLASGTRTIPHDDDGAKTISCSGYFKDGAGNGLGNATASGSLTLTQLHQNPIINRLDYSVNEPSGFIPNRILMMDNISVVGVKPIATAYDGATITGYSVSCGNIQGILDNGYYWLNFIDKIPENHNIITIATDSMGATYTFTAHEKGLVYTKPTINKFTAKRVGQLSGDIQIKASGSYFTSENLLQPIVPLVKYTIKNGETTIVNEATASSLTYSDGAWSIEEDLTNVCDYDKSYEVIITITDNLITARNSSLPTISGTQVDPVSIPSVSTIVPLGEPTWTEYKDRVDFKRLTRQKGEVYGETELYYDAEGTNGDVALDETCENFEYVEIFYYTNSGNYYGNSKIYLPNGNKAQLKAESDDGTYNYMYTANYTFNGTTLTRNTEYRWRLSSSGLQRGTTDRKSTR